MASFGSSIQVRRGAICQRITVPYHLLQSLRSVAAGCRPREVGEVHVHGPNIMMGYWNRPQETASALVGGGWYKSGDVAWADENGYLFVVDRTKNMINSGGENIYTRSKMRSSIIQLCSRSRCSVSRTSVMARWSTPRS
jgi:non-ribosomal peptide synthetase component E (peptide arylation enzyme)